MLDAYLMPVTDVQQTQSFDGGPQQFSTVPLAPMEQQIAPSSRTCGFGVLAGVEGPLDLSLCAMPHEMSGGNGSPASTNELPSS